MSDTKSAQQNQAPVRYGAVEQSIARRICADPQITKPAKGENGKIGKGVAGTVALAIYWALASHRPNIRPGIGTIAGLLSISRAAVQRGIRALEACGYIKRQHEPGHPTSYVLSSVPQDATPDLSSVPQDVTPTSHRTPPPASPRTPEYKKEKTRRENKNTSALADAAFSEWYAIYPRKVARQAAAKAFPAALARLSQRHDGDESAALEWLMERTRLYAASRVGEPRQYTKYPGTWLNGERYDDDEKDWNCKEQ